jgi:hypothetical protein
MMVVTIRIGFLVQSGLALAVTAEIVLAHVESVCIRQSGMFCAGSEGGKYECLSSDADMIVAVGL